MNKRKRGRHWSVGTYESEIWSNKSVLEVCERGRGEYGRIRLRGGGNHDGIRPRHSTYPPCVLKAYAVTVLNDCHVDPETLDKINDLLEAMDKGALTRAHITGAAVDGEAVDAGIDDALDKGQGVFLCWKQSDLRGYGDVRWKLATQDR